MKQDGKLNFGGDRVMEVMREPLRVGRQGASRY